MPQSHVQGCRGMERRESHSCGHQGSCSGCWRLRQRCPSGGCPQHSPASFSDTHRQPARGATSLRLVHFLGNSSLRDLHEQEAGNLGLSNRPTGTKYPSVMGSGGQHARWSEGGCLLPSEELISPRLGVCRVWRPLRGWPRCRIYARSEAGASWALAAGCPLLLVSPAGLSLGIACRQQNKQGHK